MEIRSYAIHIVYMFSTCHLYQSKDFHTRNQRSKLCVKAKAIITATYSGYNTIKTSSYRPAAYIYAFTNNHTILNTLSLVWGVKGFHYSGGRTTDQTVLQTKEILKKRKYVRKGDLVINIASMPAQEKGMTNMMKLSKVK